MARSALLPHSDHQSHVILRSSLESATALAAGGLHAAAASKDRRCCRQSHQHGARIYFHMPAMMVWLALALLACGQALAQDECLSNPTVPSCVNYTVNAAVLERDLGKLCSASALGGRTYTGWPAACTLWHECQQGRGGAACERPLTLLQTACNEAVTSPGTAGDVCMTYAMLCAPQSVVVQCDEQPPLRDLRPAMQLHSAVQKLCPAGASGANASSPSSDASDPRVSAGGGAVAAQDLSTTDACRSCSSMSYDPDRVTVQAVQANCPDPLGTLSTLCLANSTAAGQDGCTPWAQFCLSQESAGFTGLCGGEAATPAPSPAEAPKVQPAASPPAKAAAPTPAQATPPQRAGAAAAPPASCYSDPKQEACRTFQQGDADSQADIRQLCGSNPFLVGCSLRDQCASGAATGAYCQPFSLLGTLCLPNPAVAGCQRWGALCGTAGSTVQQCIAAAPVRNVLLTSQTMDAVMSGCNSQSGAAVSGCQQCAEGLGSGCRDPVVVMSQLCRDGHAVPQCASLANMCAEAGATFTSLCSGSSTFGVVPAAGGGTAGAAVPPEAKMYLHASMSAMIVLQSWVPSSAGAYIASCLAVIAVAVLVQAFKAVNLRLEARWALERSSGAASGGSLPAGMPGCGTPAFARSSMDGKDGRRSSNMHAPMLWRSSVARLVNSAGSPSHPGAGATRQPYVTRQELARNAARALFTGGVVWLDYMLMLVAMTFNLGLIVSATLGFCLGALVFGHWGERAAAAGSAAAAAAALVPAAGSMQPSTESDLEVHYVGAAPQHAQHTQLQHLPAHQPPIVSIQ